MVIRYDVQGIHSSEQVISYEAKGIRDAAKLIHYEADVILEPKGYIYFVMAFSVLVEFLNIRSEKKALHKINSKL